MTFLHQKPIPGYWYSNSEGQLIQVRAITYFEGVQALITLEDISNKREHINPKRWFELQLILHSPVVAEGATA